MSTAIAPWYWSLRSLESKTCVLPRVYATDERPHGVETHADQFMCDPGGGGLVGTRAIHDRLAAATTLMRVLEQNLKGDGSGNDPVAYPTRARPRVDQAPATINTG
jgi:hypothetical protein